MSKNDRQEAGKIFRAGWTDGERVKGRLKVRLFL